VHYGDRGVAVAKEPLTVDGEVRRGRCLLCHPLPVVHQHQQPTAPYWSPGSLDSHIMLHSDNTEAAPPSSAECVSVYSGSSASHDDPKRHESSHSQVVSPSLRTDSCNNTLASRFTEGQFYNNGSNTNNNTQHNSKVHEDPDICTILSAMRLHPHSHTLQISSLHMLYILSYESENASAIGRVGGIPTILDVLRSTNTNVVLDTNEEGMMTTTTRNSHNNTNDYLNVAIYGIGTLQNLAAVTEYNRDAIVEHGGLPLIIATMSTFLSNSEIQRSSCTALANISKTSLEYKIAIRELGGMNSIMKAVEVHSECEFVLRAAYRGLRKLGMPRLSGLGRAGGGGRVTTEGDQMDTGVDSGRLRRGDWRNDGGRMEVDDGMDEEGLL